MSCMMSSCPWTYLSLLCVQRHGNLLGVWWGGKFPGFWCEGDIVLGSGFEQRKGEARLIENPRMRSSERRVIGAPGCQGSSSPGWAKF